MKFLSIQRAGNLLGAARNIGLSAGILLVAAGAAQAHSFHTSSTITGPQGGQWQRSGSTSFAQGGVSHQQSLTGPGGQTVSRNGSTQYGDGSYSHGTTYTGPNGQSTGWTSTGTYGTGQ